MASLLNLLSKKKSPAEICSKLHTAVFVLAVTDSGIPADDATGASAATAGVGSSSPASSLSTTPSAAAGQSSLGTSVQEDNLALSLSAKEKEKLGPKAIKKAQDDVQKYLPQLRVYLVEESSGLSAAPSSQSLATGPASSIPSHGAQTSGSQSSFGTGSFSSFSSFDMSSPVPSHLAGDGSDLDPEDGKIGPLPLDFVTLRLLISNIHRLSFELRKDTVAIFSAVVRCVPSVLARPRSEFCLVQLLIRLYESPDLALHCGMMIRDAVKYSEPCSKFILEDENGCLARVLALVTVSNFDVASDAFVTLRDLLTKHRAMVADFLLRHFETFFKRYNELLTSENYVTKRQSLKLLGEMLLDRSNFKVMTQYIAVVEHLKLIMMLLKEKSKNIQFEAFHVFKVFVANPNKPNDIKNILFKNKEKLISFLSTFQNEKDKEDEQFCEEKALLVREISALAQQ